MHPVSQREEEGEKEGEGSGKGFIWGRAVFKVPVLTCGPTQGLGSGLGSYISVSEAKGIHRGVSKGKTRREERGETEIGSRGGLTTLSITGSTA